LVGLRVIGGVGDGVGDGVGLPVGLRVGALDGIGVGAEEMAVHPWLLKCGSCAEACQKPVLPQAYHITQ
jgi:hypothetical protein